MEQPGVAVNKKTGQPRGDVYGDFGGTPLWGEAGPKPEDVQQGFIGDCFLMAALQSVCAANPGKIKSLFSPQESGAKQYSVTLFQKEGETDQFKEKAFTVDTMLPALNAKSPEPGAQPASGAGPQLAYAGNDQVTQRPAPLWPSLVEKAYAMMLKGGYAELGRGGVPADAMSALTGQPVERVRGAEGKEAMLAKLKQFQQGGQPAVCSTFGSKQRTQKKAFRDGGQGQVSGVLTGQEGARTAIIPATIEITDEKNKGIRLADDAKGRFVGEGLKTGTISYDTGAAQLSFEAEKAPEDPQTLIAEFDYRGQLSAEYDVFAEHAYAFVRLDGENVVLKNPWGFRDPKPIPIAKFMEFFQEVQGGEPPKPDAPPKS